MQQKRDKNGPKKTITATNCSETDTNSMFTGIRAKKARLQGIVTWEKAVKNGSCTYQIIKFWHKNRSTKRAVFAQNNNKTVTQNKTR